MRLTTSPSVICVGQFTITTVRLDGLPPGVDFDSIYFDYGDGQPNSKGHKVFPENTYNYLYGIPGYYNLTATAVLNDPAKTRVTQTIQVQVFSRPDPSFDILTSLIQCFRGNLTEIRNTSVRPPGGSPIVEMYIDWGDGKTSTFPNPQQGLTIPHNYEFGKDSFLITVRLTDSAGCSRESDPKVVQIKPNLQPDFDVYGPGRQCFGTPWTLKNTTTGIDFGAVHRYTWRFGDTAAAFTRTRPFNLPIDEYNFDTITHRYEMSGTFYPVLIIEDTTGCIDSVTMNPSTAKQKPENIEFKFDVIPTFNKNDTLPHADSACFGTPHMSAVFFKQTPIDFIAPGTGDLLWNFGDPPTMQLNFDNMEWWTKHEFSEPKAFNVSLTIRCPNPAGGPGATKDTTWTIVIDVLGPKAQITSPMPPVIIQPNQQSQCLIQLPVEFPNTSTYYKSEHVWTLWDFGDDFAPKCTSFLVPNPGFPPPGGWTYNSTPPLEQLNNSTGYWIQNGIIYPGKRIDCAYSHDTLPVHRYTDWGEIYNWYRDGHDFMPWDTTRYTRNPADTSGPGAKFWVHDRDTGLWGRAVYLNPATGAFSTIQGGPDWPRIDTIGQNEPVKLPQDLEPFNRITMNRGTPDPFALQNGVYNITPKGMVADPKNQPFGFTYRVGGTIYLYPWDKKLPDSNMDLYEYIFYREVQKCHTVTLKLADTMNHGSNNHLKDTTIDYIVLDSSDCGHEATVQLALVRPDARGLGKSEKECPGKFNPDGNGVKFRLDQVSAQLGEFPGINPTCGQTYILLNHDSLADRLDNTPCQLDGFVTWQGGVTPGGISRPIFTNVADWSNPMQFWQNPKGTSTWYHYGPGSVLGDVQAPPPADPRGYVTVGLVIGAGDFNGQPLCISDTVWYHNFFFMRGMDARFFLDPTYDLNGVPTTGVCKEYCKNDDILFVYQDSTQDSVGLSIIDWGDNTFTVDSFLFADGVNDGYFVAGIRRARATWFSGACGQEPRLLEYIPFPEGLPRVDVDTIYHENYKHRVYHPTDNPNGSLNILGPNAAGDSIQINECGNQYWMPMSDTLHRWYYPEYRDKALMLLPIRHQFFSSSFEDGCKMPGIAPTPVTHILVSRKNCLATDVKGLIVRGIIDTAMTMNEKGEFDTVFCIGEPVHFYDSVRYWRPDCSQSDPVFNPNLNWGWDQSPLGVPYSAYHFDTTDYWARETGNPNMFQPTGEYVEKMKWYFGDGDSATGVRPVHRYKKPGRYVVTMLTVDRAGCLDTTWCYVYVSEPVAQATVKPGQLSCGAEATFYNKSVVKDAIDTIRYQIDLGGGIIKDTFYVNKYSVDSALNIYWWFGERTRDTLVYFDAFNDDTAVWRYRGNGNRRVKIVLETVQGCKDTAFTDVYIAGPNPMIKLIGDTIGCSPLRVKVVNLSDANNPPGEPSLTKAVRVDWGLSGAIANMFNMYDTVEYVYYDTGVFYISSIGDDNPNMDSTTGCKFVYYPDTVDGFQPPIRVRVLNSFPAKIATNVQTVCVDQPFTIINQSDTVNYLEFRYDIYKDDSVTRIDSFIRSNQQNTIVTSIADSGRYIITIEPTRVAPGLPECKLYDTIDINVKQPVADFSIDTSATPKFKFINQSIGSSEYTWFAYDMTTPGVYKFGPEDKLASDNNGDWEFDLGIDTGDFIVCLIAYTPDPAKPICADTICDTVSFRFVEDMEIFNVFTPGDGNGINDFFDIRIEGEKEYDLVIYNRWGTKVFESKDKNFDWNGKNMNTGADCPQGTYYYVFKYKLTSGKEETLNGTVTLIRQQ